MSGGKSFGSRGSRTYAAPPATKTAPGAAPIEQSMTDRRDPVPTENSALSGAATLPLLVGWRGLLIGSLIAVSLGRLFGSGMDVLGFLVQFAVIGGTVYFVVNFIRSRVQPAPASSPGSSEAPRGGKAPNRSPFTFSGGPAPRASALTIGKVDLDAFERLLGEITPLMAAKILTNSEPERPRKCSLISAGNYMTSRNRVCATKSRT